MVPARDTFAQDEREAAETAAGRAKVRVRRSKRCGWGQRRPTGDPGALPGAGPRERHGFSVDRGCDRGVTEPARRGRTSVAQALSSPPRLSGLS